MSYHSLVQNSKFFKKTKFKALKSIYFHFKTVTKQMLVFFDQDCERFNLAKAFATWEYDFEFSKIYTKSFFSGCLQWLEKQEKLDWKNLTNDMLLSSNFLKKKQNEQMLLQHVVNEVIWFIGSLIFNVLCFGFYFHFQILNLLLIFSCSLQVFTNLCGG